MNRKILFVLPKFEFGGTVFSTLNMIRMLQQHGGYDISVFPMIAYGPVRNVYDGLNVLDSDFLLDCFFANIQEYTGLYKLGVIAGKCINKICDMGGVYDKRKMYDRVAKNFKIDTISILWLHVRKEILQNLYHTLRSANV